MPKTSQHDNSNTGALFNYAGAFRGPYDHSGVECDAVLKDGVLSIGMNGALVAGARVPTLPAEHKKPVKINMVFAGKVRTERPYVIWRAENATNGVFFQIKPDAVVLEHPDGVAALLGM